jgi:hypothetical protein
MATLIITIVAIALALALAVVTVYYGGPVLQSAHDSAVAATYITGAQQIRGAARLYSVEHTGAQPTSIDDLINGHYLKTNLDGSWKLEGDYAKSYEVTLDQCKRVNEKLGLPDTISCTDKTYKGQPVCCDDGD